METNNNDIVVGLIKGRHNMPVEEYIFNEDIANVFDYDSIRKHIERFVDSHMDIVKRVGSVNGIDDDWAWCGTKQLIVYVTGLTAVTAELINVCACDGINLILMHYDRDTGSYYTQSMSWNKDLSLYD